MRHLFLLLAAVLGFSTGCQTPTHAALVAAPAASRDTRPTAALNGLFHEQYERTRSDYVARLGTEERPLLWMNGSQLVLRWKGQETKFPVLSERYHTLKSISHVPLGLYVALLGGSGPTLSEEVTASLARTQALIPAVLASLDDPGSATRRAVPPELVDVQRTLLRESAALLAEVLPSGTRPTPQRLERFALAVRPGMLAGARAAARDELDALHRHVSALREALGPEAWGRTRILISTSRQARARETSLQYFERLLGERMGEGASREERIVVLEAFGPREPVEVMATHELDQDIAEGLLGDRFRLQSDLLAPAATEYLDELLPERAPAP